jgi:sulfur carrier protein ThiS
MEAAAVGKRHKLVSVTITLTDENGESQTEEKAIEGGPTEVVALKAELGVPPESALWVVQRNGKKKQLADHAKHNVKEGDRYEALVRGGVS